ncbi:MAG: M23 family metallopeptidase [Chloroflexi bacterium]|nr:M23 family metallopeptidase [Chloroflexota bacterium]
MGWDQNAAEGTPIRAMAAGVVARAANIVSDLYGVYGRFVMIDHGYNVFTNYAHLSEALVEPGQRVEAGQIIALSGNTGRSSAPHLHWEVLAHGEWVDGLTLLDLWLPAPSGSKAEANARQ